MIGCFERSTSHLFVLCLSPYRNVSYAEGCTHPCCKLFIVRCFVCLAAVVGKTLSIWGVEAQQVAASWSLPRWESKRSHVGRSFFSMFLTLFRGKLVQTWHCAHLSIYVFVSRGRERTMCGNTTVIHCNQLDERSCGYMWLLVQVVQVGLDQATKEKPEKGNQFFTPITKLLVAAPQSQAPAARKLNDFTTSLPGNVKFFLN